MWKVYREPTVHVFCFAIFGCVAGCTARSSGIGNSALLDKGEAQPGAQTTHGTRDHGNGSSSIVVCIGGDILPGGAIRRFAEAGPDPAARFARMLRPALTPCGDRAVVLVNLESPVSSHIRHRRPGRDAETGRSRDLDDPTRPRKPVPLNAPEWVLSGLAQAGVEVVSLANNHALDQGREGLKETIIAARRQGLGVTGAGFGDQLGWPVRIRSRGVTVSILSYFERDAPEPLLGRTDAGLSVLPTRFEVLEDDLATTGGLKVVQIHIVSELRSRPKSRWRTLAHRLLHAGADAVIFHGSHVIGPMERVELGSRSAWIFYGLGNLVSDMGLYADTLSRTASRSKWMLPEPRSGLIARFEATTTLDSPRLRPGWVGTWISLRQNQNRPTVRIQPFCPSSANDRSTDPYPPVLFAQERRRLAGLLGPFAAHCTMVSQGAAYPVTRRTGR